MERCKKFRMGKALRKDIIEWDIINWGKAINFFGVASIEYTGKKVLDIGSRNGGLSLYFALQGADVVCSDLNGPTNKARELHESKSLADKITYEAIDATNIPYTEHFDIVCFKSVLGGIGYNDSKDRQQSALNQMYKALKPGGYLLFAENLTGSALHRYFRRKFVKWGNAWRYVTIKELLEMLYEFKNVSYSTFGFFGAFGRNNIQRNLLGYLDNLLCFFIPKNKRYVGAFAAQKAI